VAMLITFTFFGIVFTFLQPLAWYRNAKTRNGARQVNAKAVGSLECGARSLLIHLPNGGIQLHVVVAGKPNDKLVVLLHGFPDTWHCWRHLIPALVKNGYYVVAPDMRGYNLSEKPSGTQNYDLDVLVSDVEELITYFKKPSAAIVAHDWGGIVAWEFATQHPELTEKLIIMNAPHPEVIKYEIATNIQQTLASWYVFFFQIPFIAPNLISYNPYAFPERIQRGTPTGSFTQDDVDVMAASLAQEGSATAMINYYKALVRSWITGQKVKRAKVSAPVLILWGEDDVALLPDTSRADQYALEVKTQYIPHCSHWVPREVPDIVEQEVLKFIEDKKILNVIDSIIN